MVSRAKLYDAFGELIYAVAMCDNVIQEEEVKAMDTAPCVALLPNWRTKAQ